MTREYFFGKAKWVGFTDATKDTFSVLRGHFSVDTPSKVTLSALGLGFFKCYINGICVNPDTFLPLSSDYEAGCDPKDEVLTAHRIYVPSFDITDLVRKGDNVIVLHFGGGWYTTRHRVFGMPKGIYRVLVEEADGVREFVSDESCRLGKSFVSEYDLTLGIGAVPKLSSTGNVASLCCGNVSNAMLVGSLNDFGLNSATCAGTLFKSGTVRIKLYSLPSSPVVVCCAGCNAIGICCGSKNSKSCKTEHNCYTNCHKLSHC